MSNTNDGLIPPTDIPTRGPKQNKAEKEILDGLGLTNMYTSDVEKLGIKANQQTRDISLKLDEDRKAYGVKKDINKNYSDEIGKAQGHEFIRALARAPMNIGAGIIEGFAYLPEIFDSKGDWDNAIIRGAKAAKEWNFGFDKVYAEDSSKMIDLNDWAFYANNGVGLIESVASFATIGGAYGKLLSGGGKLLASVNRLSKLTKAIEPYSHVMNNFTIASTLAFTEGAMSGNEVYAQLYEQGRKKGYTPEKAGRLAKQGARATVSLNTTTNTALNMIGLSALTGFLKKTGQAGRTINDVTTRNAKEIAAAMTKKATESSLTKTIKALGEINYAQSIKERMLTGSLGAAGLIEASAESLEELVNLAATNTGRRMGAEEHKDLGMFANMFRSYGNMFENFGKDVLTEEGLLSGVLGFAGGIGQSQVIDRIWTSQNTVPKLNEFGEVIYQKASKEDIDNDNVATIKVGDETYLADAKGNPLAEIDEELSTKTLLGGLQNRGWYGKKDGEIVKRNRISNRKLQKMSKERELNIVLGTMKHDLTIMRDSVKTVETLSSKPTLTKEETIELANAKAKISNITNYRSINAGYGNYLKDLYYSLASVDNKKDLAKELNDSILAFEKKSADPNIEVTPEEILANKKSEDALAKLEATFDYNRSELLKPESERRIITEAMMRGLDSSAEDGSSLRLYAHNAKKIDKLVDFYNKHDIGNSNIKNAADYRVVFNALETFLDGKFFVEEHAADVKKIMDDLNDPKKGVSGNAFVDDIVNEVFSKITDTIINEPNTKQVDKNITDIRRELELAIANKGAILILNNQLHELNKKIEDSKNEKEIAYLSRGRLRILKDIDDLSKQNAVIITSNKGFNQLDSENNQYANTETALEQLLLKMESELKVGELDNLLIVAGRTQLATMEIEDSKKVLDKYNQFDIRSDNEKTSLEAWSELNKEINKRLEDMEAKGEYIRELSKIFNNHSESRRLADRNDIAYTDHTITPNDVFDSIIESIVNTEAYQTKMNALYGVDKGLGLSVSEYDKLIRVARLKVLKDIAKKMYNVDLNKLITTSELEALGIDYVQIVDTATKEKATNDFNEISAEITRKLFDVKTLRLRIANSLLASSNITQEEIDEMSNSDLITALDEAIGENALTKLYDKVNKGVRIVVRTPDGKEKDSKAEGEDAEVKTLFDDIADYSLFVIPEAIQQYFKTYGHNFNSLTTQEELDAEANLKEAEAAAEENATLKEEPPAEVQELVEESVKILDPEPEVLEVEEDEPEVRNDTEEDVEALAEENDNVLDESTENQSDIKAEIDAIKTERDAKIAKLEAERATELAAIKNGEEDKEVDKTVKVDGVKNIANENETELDDGVETELDEEGFKNIEPLTKEESEIFEEKYNTYLKEENEIFENKEKVEDELKEEVDKVKKGAYDNLGKYGKLLNSLLSILKKTLPKKLVSYTKQIERFINSKPDLEKFRKLNENYNGLSNSHKELFHSFVRTLNNKEYKEYILRTFNGEYKNKEEVLNDYENVIEIGTRYLPDAVKSHIYKAKSIFATFSDYYDSKKSTRVEKAAIKKIAKLILKVLKESGIDVFKAKDLNSSFEAFEVIGKEKGENNNVKSTYSPAFIFEGKVLQSGEIILGPKVIDEFSSVFETYEYSVLEDYTDNQLYIDNEIHKLNINKEPASNTERLELIKKLQQVVRELRKNLYLHLASKGYHEIRDEFGNDNSFEFLLGEFKNNFINEKNEIETIENHDNKRSDLLLKFRELFLNLATIQPLIFGKFKKHYNKKGVISKNNLNEIIKELKKHNINNYNELLAYRKKLVEQKKTPLEKPYTDRIQTLLEKIEYLKTFKELRDEILKERKSELTDAGLGMNLNATTFYKEHPDKKGKFVKWITVGSAGKNKVKFIIENKEYIFSEKGLYNGRYRKDVTEIVAKYNAKLEALSAKKTESKDTKQDNQTSSKEVKINAKYDAKIAALKSTQNSNVEAKKAAIEAKREQEINEFRSINKTNFKSIVKTRLNAKRISETSLSYNNWDKSKENTNIKIVYEKYREYAFSKRFSKEDFENFKQFLSFLKKYYNIKETDSLALPDSPSTVVVESNFTSTELPGVNKYRFYNLIEKFEDIINAKYDAKIAEVEASAKEDIGVISEIASEESQALLAEIEEKTAENKRAIFDVISEGLFTIVKTTNYDERLESVNTKFAHIETLTTTLIERLGDNIPMSIHSMRGYIDAYVAVIKNIGKVHSAMDSGLKDDTRTITNVYFNKLFKHFGKKFNEKPLNRLSGIKTLFNDLESKLENNEPTDGVNFNEILKHMKEVYAAIKKEFDIESLMYFTTEDYTDNQLKTENTEDINIFNLKAITEEMLLIVQTYSNEKQAEKASKSTKENDSKTVDSLLEGITNVNLAPIVTILRKLQIDDVEVTIDNNNPNVAYFNSNTGITFGTTALKDQSRVVHEIIHAATEDGMQKVLDNRDETDEDKEIYNFALDTVLKYLGSENDFKDLELMNTLYATSGDVKLYPFMWKDAVTKKTIIQIKNTFHRMRNSTNIVSGARADTSNAITKGPIRADELELLAGVLSEMLAYSSNENFILKYKQTSSKLKEAILNLIRVFINKVYTPSDTSDKRTIYDDVNALVVIFASKGGIVKSILKQDSSKADIVRNSIESDDHDAFHKMIIETQNADGVSELDRYDVMYLFNTIYENNKSLIDKLNNNEKHAATLINHLFKSAEKIFNDINADKKTDPFIKRQRMQVANIVFESFNIKGQGRRNLKQLVEVSGYIAKSMEDLISELNVAEVSSDRALEINEVIKLKLAGITDIVTESLVEFMNASSKLAGKYNSYNAIIVRKFKDRIDNEVKKLNAITESKDYYKAFNELYNKVEASNYGNNFKNDILTALHKNFLDKNRTFNKSIKKGSIVRLNISNLKWDANVNKVKGAVQTLSSKVLWRVTKVTKEVSKGKSKNLITVVPYDKDDNEIYDGGFTIKETSVVTYIEDAYTRSENDLSYVDGKRVVYLEREVNGVFTEVISDFIKISADKRPDTTIASDSEIKAEVVKIKEGVFDRTPAVRRRNRRKSRTYINRIAAEVLNDPEKGISEFSITFKQNRNEELFEQAGIEDLRNVKTLTLEQLRLGIITIPRSIEKSLFEGKRSYIVKSAYLESRPFINFYYNGMLIENAMALEDVHSYFKIKYDTSIAKFRIEPMHPGILYNRYLATENAVEKEIILLEFIDLYKSADDLSMQEESLENAAKSLEKLGKEYNSRAAIYNEVLAKHKAIVEATKTIPDRVMIPISELNSIDTLKISPGIVNKVENANNTLDKELFDKINKNNVDVVNEIANEGIDKNKAIVYFKNGMMIRRNLTMSDFNDIPLSLLKELKDGNASIDLSAYNTSVYTKLSEGYIDKLDSSKTYVGIINNRGAVDWHMAKDGRATKDEYLNTIGKIFTDKYMTALEQLSNDKADKKPIDDLQGKLNAVLDGLQYSGKRINMEGDNVMMSGFKMLTSSVEVELKDALNVSKKYKAQSTLNIAIIKGSLTLQLKTKVNGKELTFSFPSVKDLSVFKDVVGGIGRNAAVANIIVDLIKTNLFNTSDNIKAKWAAYNNPTMNAMSVMELIDPFLKKILQTKTVEQLSVKEVVEAHNYHIPFDNTSGFNEDSGFTPEWFIGKLTVNLDKTKPLFTSKRLKVIAATTQDENEVKANKAVYDSTSKRKDSEETTEEVVEEDVVVEEEGVNKVTKAAKNIAEIIAMGNDRNDAQKDKFNNYNTAVAMAKNFVKRGTKERVVLESGEAESIVPLLISMANNFKKLNELNDGSIEDLNFKRTRSQKKLTNKEITSEFSELADNLLIC